MKYLFLILIAILLDSCFFGENKKNTEIIFPKSLYSYKVGRDTIKYNLMNKTYKILVYTSPGGCTDCRLKPFIWRKLIKEVQSSGKEDQVSFIFVFSEDPKKNLEFILKKYRIEYQVYIDEGGEMGELNDFSKQTHSQAFLLNKENKILFSGNPTYDDEIWKIYKQIIFR